MLLGEVSEWFKVHAWNACMGENPSGVRISPSPHNKSFMKILKLIYVSILYCSFLLANDRIASVYFVEGNCYIKNDKTDGYSMSILTGRSIYSDDIIKVDDESNCFIRFIDDKTHIHIGPNSIIKIHENTMSREIDLLKGSIYVKNLYKENIKTYVFTDYNQIYLNNHRLWVSHSPNKEDMLFSLDNSINIFNISLRNKIALSKQTLLSISDKLLYIDNKEDFIPNYVLSDIGTFDYNMKKIELKVYDMIPVYGRRILNVENVNPWTMDVDFGAYFLNNDTHFKIGLYPNYINKNLSFNMKIESYANPLGDNLGDDWNDFIDILEKVTIEYSYSDEMKNLELIYGKIDHVSFGTGYMVNNLSNSLDYPRQRKVGLLLDYIFDVDFVDLQIVIPSLRDLSESGGVVGARTSLYISHRFPLTLGLGIMSDFNQFSFLTDYLNKKKISRSVFGIEVDYNYNFISNFDLELDFYGEFVGLWYPNYNYYILYDGNDVSNDLRWRKGSWGINAPGISIKFDNRYLFKFSLNINSATFIPNYFNSTYLYNRARFYKADLGFPLVQKQIDYLDDNFLLSCESEAEAGDEDAECEYLIPKDVYPILYDNNGFSAFDTYGFTTEFSYNMQTYIKASFITSIFIENSSQADIYCSMQAALNINDGYIRNIKNMRFYYSNLFFEKLSDKYRMTIGFETEIYLPSRLSLIINLGQVYYDSKNDIIDDNNIDKMMSSEINLKYDF